MGCSSSKQNIQSRTQNVPVTRPQQGYQGDLVECEANYHPSRVIECKEGKFQQVIPSSGETAQQPIPTSPGFPVVPTPTFCSQVGGMQIMPHIKSALLEQSRNFDHIEKKRSKSVSFKLDKLDKPKKPNYELRKKFNIDDLFL